jgi:DNA-binding response OmpR family regulator
MNEPDKTQYSVLVIEDEENERTLFCYILQARGFKAIGARNVQETIPIINNNRPDLVMIGYLDGYESAIDVARIIRNHSHAPGVPIIMMSISNKPFIEQQAIEAGVNAVLWYPLNSTELLETVRSLIG